MSLIQTIPSQTSPVICDFGWYYGSGSRLSEFTYKVGNHSYPPGITKTAGGSNQTLVASGTSVIVASTANFEPSGLVTFYGSTSQHVTCAYTVTDATHLQCTGGTGTFADGTPVFDPRFYVDGMPLRQVVTFDAIDSLNLGLPTIQVPSGLNAVYFQWDFGNGILGLGPTASTTYSYSQPVAAVRTSLTVYDSLGRRFSCAHHLNQQSLNPIYGGSRYVSHP